MKKQLKKPRLKKKKETVNEVTAAGWSVIIAGLQLGVSGLIFWANNRSVKAANKQIAVSERQFKKDNRLKVRPYLVADIALTGNDDSGVVLPTARLDITDSESPDSVGSHYIINLKNVGSGALHSASLEWSSPHKTKENLFKSGIAIAKDSSWSFAADFKSNKESAESVFTDCWLRIKYKDMLDNTYYQDILFKIKVGATVIRILRYYFNPQRMIVKGKEPAEPMYIPEGYEDLSV